MLKHNSDGAWLWKTTFTLLGAFGLLGLPRPLLAQPQISPRLTEKFLAMERRLEREFETYFGENLADVTQTPAEISKTLATLAHKTGSRAGVLWVIPREQELHLVLLLPDGAPIVKDFPNVPRDRLLETVRTYQREISDPSHDPKTSTAARQLYDWIIAPYEREHLSEAEIDSLLFCLGSGLRGLPLAALQKPNGQYLVEQYSLTSIPAFNLIDTRYRPAKRGRILAAGASLFDQLTPLPAVPMELEIVRSELRDSPESTRQWQGRSLLNQNFTLNNLKEELDATQFNIIHLATHADFKPGDPKESFIQFQDQPLRVGDLGAIPWPENLDLLVLSACKTAIGDPDAELGFSGVALKAQIKSAIGSLWSVSDLGTLALMSEFYHQLPQAPTRAIALQQAQLRLLRGEVRVGDNRLLHAQRGPRSLPSAIALGQSTDFTHPYFWAGFTMISSPW